MVGTRIRDSLAECSIVRITLVARNIERPGRMNHASQEMEVPELDIHLDPRTTCSFEITYIPQSRTTRNLTLSRSSVRSFLLSTSIPRGHGRFGLSCKSRLSFVNEKVSNFEILCTFI